MSGTTRAFVAVEINDPKILDRLQAIQDQFLELGIRMKPVEPENIHLTLKFLGNVRDDHLPKIYHALRENVNTKPPLDEGFTAEIHGIGQFSYRVLWVGMKQGKDQLKEVFQNAENVLTSQFKFPRENRKFKPHATLARLKFVPREKKGAWMRMVNSLREEPIGELRITQAVLKKSELTPKGPIYTTLEY